MKRIGALVRGRVQGVGFRYFAESTARGQALTGWVRNTSDGNVELEAQGSEEGIAGFVEELRNGPRTGYVSDLQIYEMPLLKSESGFEIRY
jgi:acylphosphatase